MKECLGTQTQKRCEQRNAQIRQDAGFTLPLEQKIFTFQVLECAKDEKVDFTKSRKTIHESAYSNDVYRVAKKFIKSLDEYEFGNVYLPFDYTDTGDCIHIGH